ncbi:MAG: class I SAM-dependent methyltransferase [Gaiellaceae bacterium]
MAVDRWKPNWNMPAGSLEHWPEDYERGRPGWPAAVVDVPDLSPSATVLELAAGTGKLTRLLVPTFRRVVAVEPAQAMRRLLAQHCPAAEVLDGSAEEIPLPAGSVDAVFVAEAFNHFDGPRAVVEIARVLRPGGAVVLMWNLPAGPWEPSIAKVEQLLGERIGKLGELSYDPLDLGGSQYTSLEWRRVFAGSPFEPVREARLENPQVVDRDGLVAFLASMGWIADLPDSTRLPLLDQVTSMLAAREYRRTWETHVHWTRLRGKARR